MKQGVSRLVKSEQAIVNSAQSFYDACVEHLQASPTNEDKCQHYMITFHFQKQLGKRPKTDKLVAIPGTHKLHAAVLDACMALKNAKIIFVLWNGQDMTLL